MRVFAFEGIARKDGDTAQKRLSAKKQIMKVMTVVMQFLKFKGGKLPIVCVFGHNGLKLASPIQEDYEEERLDCRCYISDSNLEQILIRDRPHIIITIGNRSSFPTLRTSPFEIQKRWLHYDTLPDITQLGIDAYNCYLTSMLSDRGSEDNPLITIFTPTYNIGGKICRPFESLKGQTYSNWEWVIVDDSDDGGRTFKILKSYTFECINGIEISIENILFKLDFHRFQNYSDIFNQDVLSHIKG